MCYWYTHIYNCKHVTYALGKYCSQAGLVQTPCKKKHIWQTIRMGEDCEDCAMPEGRGNNVVDNADPVGEGEEMIGLGIEDGDGVEGVGDEGRIWRLGELVPIRYWDWDPAAMA
ncbi:hypothetical protein BKA61DRAFT_673410 [Leptodontidium sp. MPI-SDFR-AT-0119]|nr:hypothetical protein BKA61DRAFT_673410 [Leptodontidium sp. MPI-SDFR-AT-0119]